MTDRLTRQLVLELSDSCLRVVAVMPDEVLSEGDGGIAYREISFGNSRDGLLKRVEDAVYGDPLILEDFGRVTVLCDTRRVMVLPDFVSPGSEAAEAAFRRFFPGCLPDGDRGEMMFSKVGAMDMTVAFEMPRDVVCFLRRTFPCVRIDHPLVPLCRYFRGKYRTRCYGKTFVNLFGDRLDVVTLGDNAPLMVNSFLFREPMDAVYYILAARQSLHLADSDEIIIGGDRLARARITPVLRRYVRYVMPAIFPAVMLKSGREALSAPFEMVLAALTQSVGVEGDSESDGGI